MVPMAVSSVGTSEETVGRIANGVATAICELYLSVLIGIAVTYRTYILAFQFSLRQVGFTICSNWHPEGKPCQHDIISVELSFYFDPLENLAVELVYFPILIFVFRTTVHDHFTLTTSLKPFPALAALIFASTLEVSRH